MSKEVIAVYQDCVLCGDKGRKQIADFAGKGIQIRKVSFVSNEGRDLCAKAVSLGIEGMPFFTDGKTFTTDLAIFEEKPVKAVKKIAKIKASEKKKQVKEKDVKNESIPEN